MKVYKHTLSNGIKVALLPMECMTTATMVVEVKTGSGYETPEENGLSHIIEHMLFNGTKNCSKQEFELKKFRIAADIIARTFKQSTRYYIKTASVNTIDAIDLLQDMIVNPDFSKQTLKGEKSVIIQEKITREEDISFVMSNKLEELMFGKEHPLSKDIIGPEENILNFSREDLIKYHKKTYVGKNTVIVVVGNFSKKQILKKLTEDFFSLKPGRETKFPKIQLKKKSMSSVCIENIQSSRFHIMIGVCISEKFYNQRNYAIEIIRRIIQMILFDKLREKGLVYEIYVSVRFLCKVGIFEIETNTHNNPEKVIKIIIEELKNFITSDISSNDFEILKENFKNFLLWGYEKSDSWARTLSDQLISPEGGIILPEEELIEINKVTVSQVRKIAKEIFVEKNFNFVILGPDAESVSFKF